MKNIHYIHHRHTTTVGLAATYAHPLEYLFGNVIAVSSGALILRERIHLWTFLMFVTWAELSTVDDHSGYNWPWSPFEILPFATSAEYHDYHHSHGHNGNYSGNYSFVDNILGNNKKFHEMIEKK